MGIDRRKRLSDWDLDLAHGQEGESFLMALLGDSTIEVKRDRQAHRTNRVAIEYECAGKPSGISITKAKWWAIILDNSKGGPTRIVLMPTEELKDIARSTYRVLGSVRGGDNGVACMVLVPIEALVR